LGPAAACGVCDGRSVRRHDRWRVLHPVARRPPGPGSADVLRTNVEDADHASIAVLALGLGAVPRTWYPGPAHRAAGARGSARARGGGGCVRPADEDTAAAGRVDRGALDRLRARPHALVMAVHPVVLPLRRVCSAVG